jgi:hypothetical protein
MLSSGSERAIPRPTGLAYCGLSLILREEQPNGPDPLPIAPESMKQQSPPT